MVRLILLLAFLGPWQAFAHSEWRGSTPAEGARLAAPPAEVTLRFNEAVQVTYLRLLDAAGRPFAVRRTSDAAPRREERATPESPLPPGPWRLEWRAISADGHPIRGTLRFTVETP